MVKEGLQRCVAQVYSHQLIYPALILLISQVHHERIKPEPPDEESKQNHEIPTQACIKAKTLDHMEIVSASIAWAAYNPVASTFGLVPPISRKTGAHQRHHQRASQYINATTHKPQCYPAR